jgi:hypothetical protein
LGGGGRVREWPREAVAMETGWAPCEVAGPEMQRSSRVLTCDNCHVA